MAVKVNGVHGRTNSRTIGMIRDTLVAVCFVCNIIRHDSNFICSNDHHGGAAVKSILPDQSASMPGVMGQYKMFNVSVLEVRGHPWIDQQPMGHPETSLVSSTCSNDFQGLDT
jgi:hypothetical protein